MPRTARIAPGGIVYHVLNRSVGRMNMFRRQGDFQAFLRIIAEAKERHPIDIFSYCILSSHWHFVVLPKGDGELSAFFRWLAHTHAMRWRVSHDTVGYGHLYQGRFKSFPVQSDEHLLTVCRYVERNALSAGLVEKAQDWRWSSLWTRLHGSDEEKALLSDWPVARPADWLNWVNKALTPREMDRLATSLKRDRPFGSETWTARIVKRLGLDHTIRPEGRPKKKRDEKPRKN
jgi:putative transposase